MKINEFKAGTLQEGYQYQFFLPELINHPFTWDDAELNALLEKASMRIGELKAFARFIPDADMFIKMHVVKEAVVSSKIEGTRTNMEDALMDVQEINPEKRDDWQEVNNYITAMNEAIAALSDLPLSNRLFKKTHATLMQGVRGELKTPGEYRQSQNWIGGATLTDAVFIPPIHSAVSDLMSDLENFLHNESNRIPHLIKIAIAHYQFETIHPFLDGNGRLGRLMITLYLVSNDILERPLLYLSDFFEKNRTNYYDKLMAVRQKNDLRQWLVFFLVGLIETSEKAIATLQGIVSIKEELLVSIYQLAGKRATNAHKLLIHLFSNPILQTKDVEQVCQISPKAAGDMIALFMELNILAELTETQRNRVFIFSRYMNLFK